MRHSAKAQLAKETKPKQNPAENERKQISRRCKSGSYDTIEETRTVSQSVSYFTVPPRAHPSTGSQSGSAAPGLGRPQKAHQDAGGLKGQQAGAEPARGSVCVDPLRRLKYLCIYRTYTPPTLRDMR